jgi:hypothetical protein
MAFFTKLFFRKPPDRLLEISERVYGMLNLYNFRFELTCCLGYFSPSIRSSSRVFLLYKEFTGLALSFAELGLVNFGLLLLPPS